MSTTAVKEKEVLVSSNLPGVVSLLTGKTKKSKETPGKKGRPELHKFAGRITFLRSEVEEYLKNGDAFIEIMRTEHALSAERRAQLIAEGVLPQTQEMYYTFQGPIPMVLEEMKRVIQKYSKKASIRCDFHKVRTVTNPKKENYIEPIVKTEDGIEKIVYIECRDDVVYGYVNVVYDK